MSKVKIIYKKVGELIPYINNPRINDAGVDKVASSIKNFGFKVPITLDSGNEIITGHTRLLAAKKLGLKEVPCIVADDLTEAQVKAFRIADNKVAEYSEWDVEMLNVEFQELKDLNMDLELTGFDLDEIEELNQLEFGEPEVQDDEFDVEDELEKIEQSNIKHGDRFKLGDHILMCGDSTSKDDVKKLTDGTQMDLILTDPPYNVDYEGSNGLKIENDKFEDNSQFYEFLLKFYTAAFEVAKEGCPIYVFHADFEGVNFRTALQNAGFELKQCLIWVKNSLVLGRQDYHWRHEPILYGWKGGAAHVWAGDRAQTTVIDDTFNDEIESMNKNDLIKYIKQIQEQSIPLNSIIYHDKPQRNDVHPTMKPITLIAPMILNSSFTGDSVVDLFGGSGSTLMACEQTKRRAYTMEYDPNYCEVIIKRWEQYTGKKAEQIKE